MSVISVMKKIWAGYPGGYKSTAQGSHPKGQALPFRQPIDSSDIRSKIPPLGNREYWYPALPDKDIKATKPQVLRMLGFDMVFFRGKDGQVKALLDACPHRGAFLSLGDCFYEGFITCPYHGGTFDGDGNCVAMISEGPDSKLVGEMKAWAFPTVTLKGVVSSGWAKGGRWTRERTFRRKCSMNRTPSFAGPAPPCLATGSLCSRTRSMLTTVSSFTGTA